MAKRAIEWEAHEIDFQQKSADWFWAVGIIGLALAVVAAFFKDFLFSIFIVLAAFTIMLHGARSAKKLTIKISSQGVRINNELFPINHLKSFWIDEEQEQTWLIIHSDQSIVKSLKIPMVEIDPETIRDFLLDYLEEEHHPPGFTDSIAEYFGF